MTTDYKALLKRAYTKLEELEAKLSAAERSKREPIAVIGMGVRFPRGANDPDALWRLLRDGVDAVTEVPADRWSLDEYYDPDPDARGKAYTRWGAFLDQVDRFDPYFFGISPREANAMDPQQRLLLEVAWEALERAGYASPRIAGSSVGVYVGMVATDYAHLSRGDLTVADAYIGTGMARSIAAGRLSYHLGVHGPNMAVDTACSSSLVAIHLAVQSLRAHESDMALAGGVNLMLLPDGSVTASRSRMMSFTGRCHTFDASADGYVRAEGCAMIVLKRLSDAIADGDNVLGVILGSAINQDGRSAGIAAPNGKAQEMVIRAALEDAGIEPGDVSVIEAHGTGTPLGDPIELRALASVFGASHTKEAPLVIGSIKSNLGHTEATAGVAGLVKLLLALKHGEIPPNLHFREPNPRIPWDEIPFKVPVEPTPWTRRGERGRVAGVSSFGFSGTNAHVIVAEWPLAAEEEAAPGPERPVQVLALSAQSDEALRELAQRYEAHLADTKASLPDIVFTANTGRTHFAERLALVAESTSGARQTLAAWLDGSAPVGVVRGRVPAGDPPEVVFLFTGQGSQYAGMGRELYESSPVFRSALDRCAAVLEGELEVPLLEVLYPEPGGRGEGLLERTEYTQPALFALEWSLAELWRSWGVEPSLVLGHSVGEYVAACVAGVLEVEEALRLVAARGRLMGSLPAGGVMVAVFAPEARVREVVERVGGGVVSVAAVNAPESVVVSGAAEAVERVVAELVGAGVGVQRLRVSHAFHSALMDPVVAEFERVARGVRYGEARLGVVSNVTGEVVGSEVLGQASYWARQLREAVRYADGVKALWARGQRVFVEVGPGATLVNLGRKCVPESEAEQGVWLSSLRSGRGEWETLLSSVAELYVRGVEVDWAGVDRPYRRRRVELPTYPFQRQRYWLDIPQREVVRRGPSVHPLLGQRVRSPLLDATVFECEIGIGTHGYLTDHRIHETAVFPAAGYLEMGLAAARQVFGDGAHALEDVVIAEALVLPETGTRLVQVAVKREEDGVATFEVFSLMDRDSDAWQQHASGRVRRAERAPATPAATPLEEVRDRCTEEVQSADFYQVMTALGADYGPGFRTLSSIRRRDGETVTSIEAPAALESSTGDYLLHPALLDACIQSLGPAIQGFSISTRDGDCYMPVEVGTYRVHQPGVRSLRCRATLEGDRDSEVVRGDVELYDADDRLIGEMRAVRLLRIDREMIRRVARRASQPRLEDLLYRVEWQRVETPSAEPAPGTWLILADRGGVADALVERLEQHGHVAVLVRQNSTGGIGRERIAAALGAAREAGGLPYRGAIHLVGLDAASAHSPASLDADHERICGSALALVQASAAAGVQDATVLYVTRGAQAVTGEEDALAVAQAPLWGLVRTVQIEHTESRAVLLDLEPSRGPADTQEAVDAILAELGSHDGEDQVAWRGGQRYAARLVRHTRQASGLQLPAGRPYEITVSERGVLDNIVVRPVERRPPGPGEVEIEVRASGLNFRDVLNVLGMYPGDPGPIGSECAGVVTAVGAGVEHVAVGDAVMAMGQGAFGSYMNTPAHSVYRMPAGMSFAEAASIPVAFMTAYYGLHELARIREGDRVLIHAAAGGVGQAAVQLALRAGAEVFGTAGSPEKRAYLRSIGVHHVFDSRTLDFADGIMEVTGGRGVDIVLNSLADEFIPRSLAVLADHGRFLEIGKRGVWTAEQVAELNPSLEYHLYDLGVALLERPAYAAEMLDRLVPEFESGALRPLPLHAFAARDAVDAFRFMAQARHMGKIVITHGDATGGFPIHADATYLITGGAGGLGLVVARALVARGARHLVLMGRSAPREAASAEIAELTASGARIELFRGDVGNEDDVVRLMDHVAASLPPLRGIVHAAGVVDDGVLLQQSWDRFRKVARPKIAGAWNLHAATRARPLDFFVLFSTGSAILGSAGQGNYAAANAFLDALAHSRRAEGLPALSINWGAWAGGGMAALVSEHDRQRWSEMGVGLIEPDEGILALERLIADGATQAAVLPMDWSRYLEQPGASERPILRSMLGGTRREPRATGGAAAARPRLREELEAADPARRLEILVDHVRDRVVKVLGLGPSVHLDARQLLTEMGMDSLMAVELSNHLQASLACKLPPTLAFEYPSISALAEYLATDVLGWAPPGNGGNGTDAPADGQPVITHSAVME